MHLQGEQCAWPPTVNAFLSFTLVINVMTVLMSTTASAENDDDDDDDITDDNNNYNISHTHVL